MRITGRRSARGQPALLEAALSGSTLVRLAWPTVWAFLRISTNSKVFEHPLSPAEATTIVSVWLERPNVDVLDPGERHWEILQRLMTESQCTGPLVTDAVLAALAIEHGATLYTTDRDFSIAAQRSHHPNTEAAGNCTDGDRQTVRMAIQNWASATSRS